MARKIIVLKCEFCGEEFERLAAEHNRNIKKNRATLCSLSCSACYRNANTPKETKRER